MTRVFVTGGTGFAGSHLIDSLLEDGSEVFGLVHPGLGHQPLPVHKNFTPVEGDLTDAEGIKTALKKAEPDVVYHLGGIASPAYSWKNPAKTLAINAGGTANLLSGAQQTSRPRIIVVTSALLYGTLSESDLPIDEDTPPSPSHPYAVSKWTASLLLTLYWRRYSLHVIEARPFNHIGPRQAPGFVVPDFASQLAKIENGMLDPIVMVGNLEAGRDFTDVRDITRAYRILAEQGEAGETYLVCSGKSTSIQKILDTLIDIAGIKVSIIKDPDRYRPLETPNIFGSYRKIQRTTGWQPVIPLEQSLKDAYLEWRELQSHGQS